MSINDLPFEVQVEIFSTLSVKHVGNILTINKATHDQLMISEAYWKSLIKNYSKIIGKQFNEELFEISKVKEQIIELIQLKKLKMQELKEIQLDLELLLFRLQETNVELGFNLYPLEAHRIEREIEAVNEEICSGQKKLQEIENSLARMLID